MMTRGEVTSVQANGKLTVNLKDSLLGDNVAIEADLVVLAVGMVPNAADGELIRELHRLPPPGRALGELAGPARLQPRGPKSSRTTREPKFSTSPTVRVRTCRPQVRLPGLALHLLPLRDSADRHLCRRHGARADGISAGR